MPNKYLPNYYVLTTSNTLKRRLTTCIVEKRAVVLAEDAETDQHAARLAWAKKVTTPAQAEAMADRMILDVLADPVIFTDPEQVNDADPDGRLSYILNDPTNGLLFNADKLAAYNA